MKTKINLDGLKQFDERLYKVVVYNVRHASGSHDVNISDLPIPPVDKMRLVEFVTLPPKTVTSAAPQADSFDETIREQQADMQRRADVQHAKNRLNEYASIGLIDSQANADLIRAEIDRDGGVLNVASVDRAIHALGDKLTWREETLPTPTPAAEVLRTLKDGSKQLPLDAVPTRRHSKEQLQDWLKRTNAGKLLRPRGSFSSSF